MLIFVYPLGGAPENDVGLSHPGVCEPTESALCIQNNGWEIDCSDGLDYTCPGVGDAGKISTQFKCSIFTNQLIIFHYISLLLKVLLKSLLLEWYCTSIV